MSKTVRPIEGYAMLNRRRMSLLKKMSGVGPFIMATPTYLRVRCGHPTCECASDKKKRHEKLHLSWSDSEGNGTCYVPVALREEVLEWVKNYWTVKDYMTEMTLVSRKMIRMYAKTQGRFQKLQKKKQLRRKT